MQTLYAVRGHGRYSPWVYLSSNPKLTMLEFQKGEEGGQDGWRPPYRMGWSIPCYGEFGLRTGIDLRPGEYMSLEVK